MSSDSVSGSRSGSVHDLIRRFEGKSEETRVMPRCLPPKGKENRALILCRTPTRDPLTMRSDGNSTPSDHPYSFTSTEMAVKDSVNHIESFQTATSSIWECDSHDPFLEAPFDERRATRFFSKTDDYYDKRENRNESCTGRSMDDERTEESFASAKTSNDDECPDDSKIPAVHLFPSDEMMPDFVESFPSDETSSTTSTRAPTFGEYFLSSDEDIDAPPDFQIAAEQAVKGLSGEKEEDADVEVSSSASGQEVFEAFEVDLSTGYIGDVVDAASGQEFNFESVATTNDETFANPERLTSMAMVGNMCQSFTRSLYDETLKIETLERNDRPSPVKRELDIMQVTDSSPTKFRQDKVVEETVVTSSSSSDTLDCLSLGTENTPPTFFPLYKIASSMESIDLDQEIETFFSKKANLLQQGDCQELEESTFDLLRTDTVPSIDEDDNIEIFLTKRAPPEGASQRFIHELNKFIVVASPFLERQSPVNEEGIRNAAQGAGVPIVLVDRLLWQIKSQESVHVSYSGDFDLAATPSKGNGVERKDAQAQSKEDRFGLFGILKDLVQRRECGDMARKYESAAQDEDDNASEEIPYQILLRLSSESASIQSEVEELLTPPVGASVNYARSLNKFKAQVDPLINDFSKAPGRAETVQIWEAAQLAGVSPKTVNDLLDILERRQRLVPHLVSTLSSSLPDDEYQDMMDGEEEINVLEWIENILNSSACEKRGVGRGDSSAMHQHFEFAQFDEQTCATVSTIPSVNEDSRIEKYLAKFTAPEGASTSEIDQLNDFLKLAVPICVENPTKVQQAQIRQAASRINFPLEIVDHFIEQAVDRGNLSIAICSSATEKVSTTVYQKNSDTVASNEINELLRRLVSRHHEGNHMREEPGQNKTTTRICAQSDEPSWSPATNATTSKIELLAQLDCGLTCNNKEEGRAEALSPNTGSTLSSESDVSTLMKTDQRKTDVVEQRNNPSPETIDQHPEHSWRSASDQVSTLSGSVPEEGTRLTVGEGFDVSLGDTEIETSGVGESWRSLVHQHTDHEVLKLVGEVEIRSSGSESTMDSMHQNSMIENFLAKFTPPEGASVTEIDQLNQFLRLAAPICAANPTLIQQAQIRQAAASAKIPLRFVDCFIELATEKPTHNVGLCASSSSEISEARNVADSLSEIKCSVDSDDIADLLLRLERRTMNSNPSLSQSSIRNSPRMIGSAVNVESETPVDFDIGCLSPCLIRLNKKRNDKHVSFGDPNTEIPPITGRNLESHDDFVEKISNAESGVEEQTVIDSASEKDILGVLELVSAAHRESEIQCIDEEFPAFQQPPKEAFSFGGASAKRDQQLISYLLRFAPTEASMESVKQLFKQFATLTERILANEESPDVKVKLARHVDDRNGGQGLLVDHFSTIPPGDLSEVDVPAPLSTTASAVSTWSAYKPQAYSMEDENQDEAIAAFLQRFSALARGEHFPNAEVDSHRYPDSFPDDAIDVDASYGYVNKSLSPVYAPNDSQPQLLELQSTKHCNHEVFAIERRVSRNHFRFESVRMEHEPSTQGRSSQNDDGVCEDIGVEVDLYGFVQSNFEPYSDALHSTQDWKRTSLRVTVWDAQPGSSEDKETTKSNLILPHGVVQEQRHFTFHHVSASSPPQRIDCLSFADPVTAESFKHLKTSVKSTIGLPPHWNFADVQNSARASGNNPMDVITTFTHYIVDPIADDPLFHHVAVSWEQFTAVQKSCTLSSCYGKFEQISTCKPAYPVILTMGPLLLCVATDSRVDKHVYEHVRISCRSQYPAVSENADDKLKTFEEGSLSPWCPNTPSVNDEIMISRSPANSLDRPKSVVAKNLMNLTSALTSSHFKAAQNVATVDDEILASRSGSWPFDEILFSRSPVEEDVVDRTSNLEHVDYAVDTATTASSTTL